jgi:hypothetical protein
MVSNERVDICKPPENSAAVYRQELAEHAMVADDLHHLPHRPL